MAETAGRGSRTGARVYSFYRHGGGAQHVIADPVSRCSNARHDAFTVLIGDGDHGDGLVHHGVERFAERLEAADAVAGEFVEELLPDELDTLRELTPRHRLHGRPRARDRGCRSLRAGRQTPSGVTSRHRGRRPCAHARASRRTRAVLRARASRTPAVARPSRPASARVPGRTTACRTPPARCRWPECPRCAPTSGDRRLSRALVRSWNFRIAEVQNFTITANLQGIAEGGAILKF